MGDYLSDARWAEFFDSDHTYTVRRVKPFKKAGLTIPRVVLYEWCRGEECVGSWSDFDDEDLAEASPDGGLPQVIGFIETWRFSNPSSAWVFKLRFG